MKRWKKSVVELKTDGAPLLESIIHQLKDLREAYSGDYPLGFITLNTEEYKRLKILCGRYVLSPPTQLTPYNSLIMSLTMVQFAIKEKKTDDFWRDFFASYCTDDNQLRRSVFCKALISFCVNEGLYFHYTNGKRWYVETIKTHAVISEYTITNVMGAIRLYYREEMHEIYSEETAGYYTSRFIGIMKKSLEDENTSSGLYSIPMAFRTACSVFENALYDSVSNTLFNMNSANYRENSYRKTPAAFYAHYRHWIIIDEIRRRNKLRKASSAAVDKRNIRHYTKAAYSLGNDLAFLLHIPRLEIPEEMIYKNIVLKIYDDFAEVFDLRQELNVSGMFKFHTEEIIVKLPCFYKKLSYRITADEYVIYDSAEVMYRNYIVFDGNFEEYRSTKVPEEIFFL
ncbi:MAG: hypothetical protein IJ192_04605 [Clostridia bacterium]|nr:hypothetical protein [Clostridia bacterium]